MLSKLKPFEVQWTKSNDAQFRRVLSEARAVQALLDEVTPDGVFWRAPWAGALQPRATAPEPLNATDVAAALVGRSWAMLAIDATPRPLLLNSGLAEHSIRHRWTLIDLESEVEYVLHDGPAPAGVLGALSQRT